MWSLRRRRNMGLPLTAQSWRVGANRMIPRLLVAALLPVALLLSPLHAYANTVGDVLMAACPIEERATRRLDQKASELMAIGENGQYPLYRQAALQMYRCSEKARNPYARDWARFLYANNLYLSMHTNGEVLERAPVGLAAINNLAAATSYGDVRRAALKLRDNLRTAYEAARLEVYGSSSPSSNRRI
jgi:hypothetical protein